MIYTGSNLYNDHPGMSANRVSFSAENFRTGLCLLRLYSGTGMSIKAFSRTSQIHRKNKIRHNRALVAPKGNNQGAIDLPVYVHGQNSKYNSKQKQWRSRRWLPLGRTTKGPH